MGPANQFSFHQHLHDIHVRRSEFVVKRERLWAQLGPRRPVSYTAPTVANHNAEKERRRLAQVYAEMTDGELEKLAADAGSLSDVARQALRTELSRRRLSAP